MKNIAFYLENQSISSIDCSAILDANPGIGGTEYLIIVVSCLLACRQNDLNVVLYTETDAILPSVLRYEIVGSIADAQKKAIDEGQDYLVFKHNANHIINNVLQEGITLKLVPWCHVFLSYWELDYYSMNSSIANIVFVSKEMRDLYRDHKVFSKSTYIYNCLNIPDPEEVLTRAPLDQRKNIVTYMGSLVPFKGFHILAKAWKSVVEEVPDAQLYVIGSARVYNQDAKLGDWGYADEEYERQFIPFLLSGGELMPNVHFMGQMGAEKNDILIASKVGVPNPSGITETFCLSAVEMQMFGAKVATIKAPGYMDTVKNGLLHSRYESLSDVIISCLRDTEYSRYDEAMNFFKNNFSFDSVASRWESFFDGVLLDDYVVCNLRYRFKWLKELRRKISSVIPALYKVTMIERVLLYIERRLYGKITYLDS